MGSRETPRSLPNAQRTPPLPEDRPDISVLPAHPGERRAAAVGAGIVVGSVLALDLVDRSGVAAFALGVPRTVPTMLGAALLGLAAAVAWRLSRPRPDRPRPLIPWRVVAAALGLLALEQATSLHHWAAEWTGLERSLLIELTAVAGAAALAVAVAQFPGHAPGRTLLAVGVVAWLAGQLAEALQATADFQGVIPASLELAGCALIAGGLLLAVAPRPEEGHEAGRLGALRRQAESWIEASSPRRLALVLALVVTAFALLGGLLIALDEEYLGPVQQASMPLQWFDLNQELTFPAYFSGLLLAAMAGLAVLVSSLPAARRGGPLPWLAMAAIVAVLAFDEIVDLHGRAQRVTEVEAQVLLAPLIVVAALVGLVLLRRIWPDRQVLIMFAGGGLAWALAMAIDPATHPGSPLAFPEELLEMVGSALFVLALLVLARSGLAAERAAGGPGLAPDRSPK